MHLYKHTQTHANSHKKHKFVLMFYINQAVKISYEAIFVKFGMLRTYLASVTPAALDVAVQPPLASV